MKLASVDRALKELQNDSSDLQLNLQMQQEIHLEIFAARVIDISTSLTSVSHSRTEL